MKQFFASYMTTAEPMTRGEYNQFRGWQLPENESASDPGYLVRGEIIDQHVNWMPADVFEARYRENSDLFDFSTALALLKMGFCVARSGWNGKNMFVYRVDGSQFTVNRPPLSYLLPEGTEINYRPHFDMKYADGTYGVWVASHSDIDADDWHIVGGVRHG